MSASITKLAAIGLKAVEVQCAAEARRETSAKWRSALENWKAAHGIHEHLKAGDPLAARMFEEVGTSPVGVVHSRAQRDEKNARARLERAIQKVRRTTSAHAIVHDFLGCVQEATA